MDILIFAQTVFYLVVSLAILCLGIGLSIIAYQLIFVVKNIRSVSKDISDGSEEVKIKVVEIVNRVSQIPFLSFLKSKPKKEDKNKLIK